MRVLVGIATYQRPEKLARLLKSLEAQTYKDFFTYIVFDADDWKSTIATKDYTRPLLVEVNPLRGYVIGCWNAIHKMEGFDAHLMLVDDVELHPDCIEKAVEALKSKFPDGDGVIGISQECPGNPSYTYKPYGQTLMGKKFIERYKEVDYQVCNPMYGHWFQDEEMWQFMSSLGKTYHCKEAILNHYHPAFKKEEMDSTHSIVRSKIMREDKATFQRRQAEGKLWGKSFAQ